MGGLYKDVSTLTFEGQAVKGAQAIVQKLSSLQFGQVKVQMVSKDFQAGPQGSLLIMVNGNLIVEGQTNHLKFAQVFTLIATGGNNFYIHNDIFRLNYG